MINFVFVGFVILNSLLFICLLLMFFQDSLLQHACRSVFQAGIWISKRAIQDIPSPSKFSWTKENGQWQPIWMTLPQVSTVCRELIKCSCKGSCTQCKCAKEKLKCTPLCKCSCPELSNDS